MLFPAPVLVAARSIGTELTRDDRKKLYSNFGLLYPHGHNELSIAEDFDQIRAAMEKVPAYANVFTKVGASLLSLSLFLSPSLSLSFPLCVCVSLSLCLSLPPTPPLCLWVWVCQRGGIGYARVRVGEAGRVLGKGHPHQQTDAHRQDVSSAAPGGGLVLLVGGSGSHLRSYHTHNHTPVDQQGFQGKHQPQPCC